MHFVLISVLCSVTVAVIIKLAKINGVNHKQLIVWNYPVAMLLTYAFLKPDVVISQANLPWHLLISLGLLLPAIFVCITLSIQYGGIVKTEVAQRLSLFIPLMAAFFIFNESIDQKKIIGIVVGIIAIIFSIGWNKKSKEGTSGIWIYPLLVFLGIGFIDILFKKLALSDMISRGTTMWIVFSLSFLVALLILAYWLVIAKERLDKRSIWWGMLLGTFNFGNILFYMRAHQALPDNPSIVFTGMNIGVITVGALIGVAFFKEKLSLYNQIGVFLAVVAVLLIAYL